MLLNCALHICKQCGKSFESFLDKAELCLDCKYPKKTFKNYNPNYTRYISSEVKQTVWNRDGGKCVCCNSNTHLEFDHIIPVTKGGNNSENNVQLLCFDCNRTKSAKIV